MKRLVVLVFCAVSFAWGQGSIGGPPSSASGVPPAAAQSAGEARQPGAAAVSPVNGLLKLLLRNVNSTEAMSYMRTMWENDRWFTFPRFDKTAQNVAEMMRQAGLDDVQIGYAPADGVTQRGFWTEPLAWDVHVGKLEIVSPNVPDEERVLADYQRVPTSLCMWSGPTPPGGVTTEIVLAPKDLQHADLKGKLVLGGDRFPKAELAKTGALGEIHESTKNPALLDERDWVNSFGDNGWSFTKGSAPLVCYSITPRSDQVLHRLLAHGPVKVHADVDSHYYSGQYPYVSGAILGTDGAQAEEVFSLGHLFEEGAGDNSTGVASIIEATATLNRLIKEGKLPRPRRTIRILAMGEKYGTLDYMAKHRARIKRTIAGMCIDSAAGLYNLPGTEFTWMLNPQSDTSFVDALILRLAKEYDPMVGRHYYWNEYSSGTDNDWGDPMINVPMVIPRGGDGITDHHTSFDTPKMADPRSLRDLSVMNAAYAYFIASAGPDQMRWMAQLALSRGENQIGAAAQKSLDQIAAAQNADQLSRLLYWETARVDYNLARESKAVKQADNLPQGLAGMASFAASQKQRIERAVQQRAAELHLGTIQPFTPRVNPEAEKIIVRRKRWGTITMDTIPRDQRDGYPAQSFWGYTVSALYWCDGKRNLADVIKLTKLELGPRVPPNFNWVGYFEFLRQHGFVDFVTPSR